MKLQDIRAIARNLNLKHYGVSKSDLIQKIQVHEGHFDCYATATLGICDRHDCLWRADCFSAAREYCRMPCS